jgi:hypothetical protein
LQIFQHRLCGDVVRAHKPNTIAQAASVRHNHYEGYVFLHIQSSQWEGGSQNSRGWNEQRGLFSSQPRPGADSDSYCLVTDGHALKRRIIHCGALNFGPI